MKNKISTLILLAININIFCQVSTNKLNIRYLEGINYYFAPNPIGYERNILFIAAPSSVNPEYSLSIEKNGNDIILKSRSFKLNYWQLLYSKIKSPENVIFCDIDSIDKKVSYLFADKFEKYFQSVLKVDPSLVSNNYQVDDATIYYLNDKNQKRIFKESDFSTSKSYFQLIKYCESIVKDLKTNTFDEDYYQEQIDSLIVTIK